MTTQTASERLKESIRLLEIKQEEEGKILKEQLRITYESLKPVNLIKSSLKEITSSVEVKNDLFGAIMSILSGYLTKRMVVGSESNVFMKLIGALLQFGVTGLIAKNADTIREFFSVIIDKLVRPAEETTQT
ncbi:MAG: hypothetical protein A2W90_23630 [Bacteroidetes bacterium GWF2_42_66]|nr:MAG: hypothetical protein A2W92_19975 [Bacteroidetes bacterium GWA2_42_15]OFY00316.1 MAG: hypothetical protein A2W89_14035 [Bacteroidetes bacterium GWE2_42_39]OFY47114.1 MAG: hypothetical protein A2W90_23630 [Bacteroidetes bacterium GWF2_42_66]HBL76710.1 hypothetical protein [Prolixibacteraceae bacterium]HCR91767.1 hypothetical protein [Prolixibacteraceae bacterium]